MVVSLQVVTLLPDCVWGARGRWPPRGIERDLADRVSKLSPGPLPPTSPVPSPGTPTPHPEHLAVRGRVPASWTDPSLISMRDPQSSLLEPRGGLWGALFLHPMSALGLPDQGPEGRALPPDMGGRPALLPALALRFLSHFWPPLELSGRASVQLGLRGLAETIGPPSMPGFCHSYSTLSKNDLILFSPLTSLCKKALISIL